MTGRGIPLPMPVSHVLFTLCFDFDFSGFWFHSSIHLFSCLSVTPGLCRLLFYPGLLLVLSVFLVGGSLLVICLLVSVPPVTFQSIACKPVTCSHLV